MNGRKTYCTYILCNKPHGVLYVGVTNDLSRRMCEHLSGEVKGFTSSYNVHRLVYYEQSTQIAGAIMREKQLKWWRRAWKVELIESANPDWVDLFVNGEVLPLPKEPRVDLFRK